MFDMNHTGTTIAERRRAKNMTQMALADALNISYQAVSNWERGISMPDISKLPELSELLDVSIDELLGKKSAVIDDVLAEGKIGEDADVQEIAEAVPILKPDQIEEYAQNTAKRTNLRELEPLWGSFSLGFRMELFRKALDQGEDDIVRRQVYLLPRENVDALCRELEEKGDFDKAMQLVPGLSENRKTDLFRRLMQTGNTAHAEKLAAEVDPVVLDEYLETDSLPRKMLRHVHPDSLAKEAVRHWERNGVDDQLHQYMKFLMIHPVLCDETCAKLLIAEYERRGTAEMNEILFFASRETRGKIGKHIFEKEGIAGIKPIMSYLDSEKVESWIREQNT